MKVFYGCLRFVVGLEIKNFIFSRHDYLVPNEGCFQILERIFLWGLSRGHDYFFPNKRCFQILESNYYQGIREWKKLLLLDNGFS